ncbi:MAG TPA: hypothetical protein VH475_14695 [Tepidisphaeraceae bacterium]
MGISEKVSHTLSSLFEGDAIAEPFRYNHRHMNDGDRTVAAIRAAEGKRLMYRAHKGATPATPEEVMPTGTEPVVWKESLFD